MYDIEKYNRPQSKGLYKNEKSKELKKLIIVKSYNTLLINDDDLDSSYIVTHYSK